MSKALHQSAPGPGMSSDSEGNSPPTPPEGGGGGEGGEAGAAAAAAAAAAAGGGVPPLPPSLLGSGAPLAAALGELVAGAGEEEADMGRLQVFTLEVFLTKHFQLMFLPRRCWRLEGSLPTWLECLDQGCTT